MSENLKQALLKEAQLLSISQSDCDLFFIGQANAITYEQLAAASIHGATKTSGRLSIKKLEKEGYLTAKTMPGNARTKYYFLTAKGRKRVERLFGEAFIKKMCLDLERRPPASQQQLPHRIHTGDIYFTYLSNPFLDHLPLWLLEHPYREPEGVLLPPRCDGLLQTAYGNYYIKQDNCTQGESALGNKLSQYMSAECFIGTGILRHTLIFTLNAEAKERPVKKPPYSVYRILLKAIRVWKALEGECGEALSFTVFCLQFDNNPSPNLLHLSGNDRNILKNLCLQYPDLMLDEMEQLKKSYLYDTSLEEDKGVERDILFSKRLRQKFYPLPESKDQASLQYRLRKGMHLYVLPNHRLGDYLPFALQGEYLFEDFLRGLLFHMGLNDLEAWEYHSLSSFHDKAGNEYIFRNVFTSGCGIRIVAEDAAHDLGGRERTACYLKNHAGKEHLLFLLFVSSREDAALFLDTLETALCRPENSSADICFVNKSAALYQNPASQAAYFRKQAPNGMLWLPAMIDYDAFLAELHLMERH
ncbi:MAG: hypothetical protein K2O91_22945 [Lachnospiraceae bacterium]|nr:hypothetical protein [Lachnospiraceae bacterium]